MKPGAKGLPQPAVPRQGVHTRQATVQDIESHRAKTPVAHHVRTVGAHALRPGVVQHPAALGLRGYVGSTEVIHHHHHHDKSQGDSRADHAGRRIEAVLDDEIKQLFHTNRCKLNDNLSI